MFAVTKTIPKIMWNVVAALVPAAAFGVYYFGVNALVNIIVAIVSAVIFEFLWEKAMHKRITITDGSAVITGLLLAMTCPPSLPWWMSIVGSFLAIVVCKQAMGGLGYNIFNPAHVGRAGLMVSWPVAMTTWTQVNGTVIDGVAGATPLNVFKHGGSDALFQLSVRMTGAAFTRACSSVSVTVPSVKPLRFSSSSAAYG